MSESSDSDLCSQCRKPAFNPRVDVDSSDLYSRLRSESGPSAVQRQDIEDLLLLCDRDYEDYELEVARLESQILYIRQQQKQLKRHKKTLRSLCSPIRKLPNEILRLIFDYACKSNLLQEFPWSLDSKGPPTDASSFPITFLPASSISATCSRWRCVAMSTPSLWSRLKLEISAWETSPKNTNAFTDALELYLQRSKDYPLDINLHVSGDEGLEHKPLPLTLLIQHSKRWKSFQFDGDVRIDCHLPPGMDFNLLERVDIDPGFVIRPWSLDIFENAPRLREASISNLPEDSEYPLLFPWRRLTHLDFEGHNPLGRVVELSPNLVTLVLWEHEQITYAATPLISSQKLQSLTVYVCESEAEMGLLEHVLSSFTFPSLLELCMDALHFKETSYSRTWPKHAFNAFVSRSSCRITKISLRGIRVSDSDIISALSLLPSIQDLIISDTTSDSPITSKFIRSLDGSGQTKLTKSRSPLVPRLRHLSLEFHGVTFDDKAFISMVSSRWLPDSKYAAKIKVDCLRSVVLNFVSRKVDETVYKPLKYLDRMGLMVVVTGTKDEDDVADSKIDSDDDDSE